MKKITTVLMLFLAVGLSAQEDSKDKLSFSLSLNQDAFFGFTPMMTASYELSETTALTAYGIQWGAGTGSAWGQWTEIGFGYAFQAGDFNINPQLGFTMGSLLSSGATQRGVYFDGIVPNLTVNYDADKFEGQIYIGYYGALTDNTGPGNSTNNYMHYWANLGYKVSGSLSIGLHAEELYLSGGSTNGGGSLARTDGYFWFGPYVQLTKGDVGARFSFGDNYADSATRFAPNDFYKLSFFFSL